MATEWKASKDIVVVIAVLTTVVGTNVVNIVRTHRHTRTTYRPPSGRRQSTSWSASPSSPPSSAPSSSPPSSAPTSTPQAHTYARTDRTGTPGLRTRRNARREPGNPGSEPGVNLHTYVRTHKHQARIRPAQASSLLRRQQQAMGKGGVHDCFPMPLRCQLAHAGTGFQPRTGSPQRSRSRRAEQPKSQSSEDRAARREVPPPPPGRPPPAGGSEGRRHVPPPPPGGPPAACLLPAGGRALPFLLPPPVPPFQVRVMRFVD